MKLIKKSSTLMAALYVMISLASCSVEYRQRHRTPPPPPPVEEKVIIKP